MSSGRGPTATWRWRGEGDAGEHPPILARAGCELPSRLVGRGARARAAGGRGGADQRRLPELPLGRGGHRREGRPADLGVCRSKGLLGIGPRRARLHRLSCRPRRRRAAPRRGAPSGGLRHLPRRRRLRAGGRSPRPPAGRPAVAVRDVRTLPRRSRRPAGARPGFGNHPGQGDDAVRGLPRQGEPRRGAGRASRRRRGGLRRLPPRPRRGRACRPDRAARRLRQVPPGAGDPAPAQPARQGSRPGRPAGAELRRLPRAPHHPPAHRSDCPDHGHEHPASCAAAATGKAPRCRCRRRSRSTPSSRTSRCRCTARPCTRRG